MKKNGFGVAYVIVFMIIFIGFLLFWIESSLAMGAPLFFPIFGIGVLVLVVLQFLAGIKSHQNMEERRREQSKHVDQPMMNDYANTYDESPKQSSRNDFCPFCGAKIQKTFEYCPKCGNHLQ